jgi:hypothetical protein
MRVLHAIVFEQLDVINGVFPGIVGVEQHYLNVVKRHQVLELTFDPVTNLRLGTCVFHPHFVCRIIDHQGSV